MSGTIFSDCKVTPGVVGEVVPLSHSPACVGVISIHNTELHTLLRVSLWRASYGSRGTLTPFTSVILFIYLFERTLLQQRHTST